MTCRNVFGSPPLAGVRLLFDVLTFQIVLHTVPNVYSRVRVNALVCVRACGCVCVYHPQTGNDFSPKTLSKTAIPDVCPGQSDIIHEMTIDHIIFKCVSV